MIKISTDQALDRWDDVPMVLRDALFSEPNSDFLWKTCRTEHIPEQKIYDVARISGYVLMGFLHPEDVAEELKDSVGIDPKTSLTIQTALNQRIFTPLRPDIDKIYAPLSKSTTPVAPAPAGPQIISETFTAMPTVGGTPLASNKNIASPAPQAPKPDAGWSKLSPQEPVVRLGAIPPATILQKPAGTMPMTPTTSATPNINTPAKPVMPTQSNLIPPKPAPNPMAISATPKSATQPGKTMSEFERLDLMKKTSGSGIGAGANTPPKPAMQTMPNAPATPVKPSFTASPSIAMPTAPAAPKPTTITPATQPMPVGPMIIHEANDSGSMQKFNDFRLNSSATNQLTGNRSGSMPVKPAVLELGNTSAPAAKVVHYSEYKTTTPPVISGANDPSRQISEITQTPKPPSPPVQ